MLDLVIGGILCFISTYLGIVGKQYYDKRFRFLRDFVSFLINLSDNLTYTKDNLPYVIDKYAEQNKGAFCEALNKYKNYLIEGKNSAEEIKEVFGYKYLKKGEKSYLAEFFVTLGKMDYDSQVAKLNLAKTQAEKMRDKAENDSKTTGTVLSKLGLLLGISIMLIMA